MPKRDYTTEELETLLADEIAQSAAANGDKPKRVRKKRTAAEAEATAEANAQHLESELRQELASNKARLREQKLQQQERQHQEHRGPTLPQQAAGQRPGPSQQQQQQQHGAHPDSTFEQNLHQLSADEVGMVAELDSGYRGRCCGQCCRIT
jgi:FtsZ-interacting cell division protein ZipA